MSAFSTCPGTSPRADCLWSGFSEWSPCSATCGEGQQQRRRMVLQPAAGGGKECFGDQEETRQVDAEVDGMGGRCKRGFRWRHLGRKVWGGGLKGECSTQPLVDLCCNGLEFYSPLGGSALAGGQGLSVSSATFMCLRICTVQYTEAS